MQNSLSFLKFVSAIFFLLFYLASFKPLYATENQEMVSVNRLDYLKVTPPVYPELARQKGWQGTVVLKTLVEKNGTCTQVVVEKSSGYVALDEAALKAVKNWEFYPAHIGNSPYAVLARVPVRFVLVGKKQNP